MIASPRAATVIGAVVADPGAWLLGSAGFLVRGGIVLLVAPIWAAPSPVGISVLVGPQIIDTGRLTGTAFIAAFIGVAALVLLAAGAVLASAWLEAATFDRLGQDPEAAAFAGVDGPAARPRRLRMLAAVQVLALVPVAFAALVAAGPIADAVRTEVLLPTDLTMPLVLRAARLAVGPLAILVASIVLAEVLSGWLSRRVLLAGVGRRRPISPIGAVRAVAAILGASIGGWLIAGVVLLPALGAVVVAWDGVRRAWLDAPFDASHVSADLGAAAATMLFVAVWVGALLLSGVVSAVRGALWTAVGD